MNNSIRILVIDDDVAWQKVMLFMLSKRGGYDVKVVSNVEAARQTLLNSSFDIVITDLYLVERSGKSHSGLQIFEVINDLKLSIPVIVISGKGDERSVVSALQHGAVNYVPKMNIRSQLYEVLDSVVNAIRQQDLISAFRNSLQSLEKHYRLESNVKLIGPLIEHLKKDVLTLSVLDSTKQTQTLIAIEEALSNAIIHGNLEVSSDLREESIDEYYRQIKQRSQTSPYCERHVDVDISLNLQQFVITIQNQGDGFDFNAVADPRNSNRIDLASGRGILLMRTFMDDVEFTDDGRCVRMTRHMRAENSNSSPQRRELAGTTAR